MKISHKIYGHLLAWLKAFWHRMTAIGDVPAVIADIPLAPQSPAE
jgi:hypothetical protein